MKTKIVGIKIWVLFLLLIPGGNLVSQYQVPGISCSGIVSAGYTNRTSYLPGEDMLVYLDANSSAICSLGIYDVHGKLVFKINANVFSQQKENDKAWENGFGYDVTAKIKLPISLASGLYSIENIIPFVVKSSGASDITVVYPINTLQAYNPSGDKSLYTYNSTDGIAAATVSFLRPMEITMQQDYCDHCLKWFPSLSNVKTHYIADVDMEDPSSFVLTKIVVIIGHSEYWTLPARRNFDNFVNKGGHAIILSGNTMFWQSRYSKTNNSLTCFRDASADPETNQYLKTIPWVDSSLHYPILKSIGANFVHGGYGLKTDPYRDAAIDRGWDGFKIVDPASPLLEGLHFQKGDILSLPTTEYDGAPIKGFDEGGFPILDNDVLKFEKLELIGFDRAARGGKETIPTFIVMQKTKTSGIVVNMASTNWCSSTGIGSMASGSQIKTITRNAILKLLNGENVFNNHIDTTVKLTSVTR
jgi:hypothetical protein